MRTENRKARCGWAPKRFGTQDRAQHNKEEDGTYRHEVRGNRHEKRHDTNTRNRWISRRALINSPQLEPAQSRVPLEHVDASTCPLQRARSISLGDLLEEEMAAGQHSVASDDRRGSKAGEGVYYSSICAAWVTHQHNTACTSYHTSPSYLCM